MDGLEIEVSYSGKHDEFVIFAPRGYIDTATVDAMEDKLMELVSQEKYKLIIDFSDTEYVNSSGWGVFLRDLRMIRENGGDIVLANMAPDVHIVYETMEFSQIFKSFNSLDAACKSFLK